MSGTTEEQRQRDEWDRLLTDLERRAEQVRQIRSYEAGHLVLAGLAAGATLFGIGAVMAVMAMLPK